MAELFQLVKQDPEVWSPVQALGAVMPLSGEPEIGDFLVSNEGVNTFMCTEVTRVRVSKLEGISIEFEIGRGVPNWFQQAQSAIAAHGNTLVFAGAPLGVGDYLVFDGVTITLEKSREAETH